MIYFLVTTSLIEDNFDKRKIQYERSINKLIQLTNDIPQSKIIILENNGKRPTFLDSFNLDVFYTDNNKLKTKNKGIKEIKDILDCVKHYDIHKSDFVVKMTGRYLLDDNSQFINIIKNIDIENTFCVIKYGSYHKPSDTRMLDCICGLIGMKVKYLMKFDLPGEKIDEEKCIEYYWAKISQKISKKNVIAVQGTLGIHINPNRNKYFLV